MLYTSGSLEAEATVDTMAEALAEAKKAIMLSLAFFLTPEKLTYGNDTVVTLLYIVSGNLEAIPEATGEAKGEASVEAYGRGQKGHRSHLFI